MKNILKDDAIKYEKLLTADYSKGATKEAIRELSWAASSFRIVAAVVMGENNVLTYFALSLWAITEGLIEKILDGKFDELPDVRKAIKELYVIMRESDVI